MGMDAKNIVLIFLLTFGTKSNCDPNILGLLSNFQNILSSGNVNFMQLIQDFMEKQNLNMDDIMRYLKMFALLSDNKILQNLVENPMELMLYVQNLAKDWQYLEDLFENPDMDGEVLSGLSQSMKGSTVKPTENDLNEVSLAVVRIQDVYNLDISDILSGKFDYFKPDTPLTVSEHIRLGQQSAFNFDFDLAVKWFEKALLLQKEKKEKSEKQISKSIEKLKELKGLINSAMNLFTPKLIQSLALIPGLPTEVLHHLRDKSDTNHPDNKMLEIYKKLCRGEKLLSEEYKSTLNCMFIRHDITGDLQRVKIEYLSNNPLVAILHDVVSDKEIEKIKDLAKPNLKPVKIHKYDNLADMRASPVRTGKSAWVSRNTHSILENLYTRVEDFTGLSTTNAEPLQVMHYGIGGHYEVHTDFFNTHSKKKKTKNIIQSDRIATLLLYLSDVYAGGFTVFPQLQLAVRPEKGSALFWFNLLRSGEGDFRMVHAACPVLSSNKWIANLWISDKDQIFHRPCAIEKNE